MNFSLLYRHYDHDDAETLRNILADDSAGRPLAQTAAGRAFLLTAEVMAENAALKRENQQLKQMGGQQRILELEAALEEAAVASPQRERLHASRRDASRSAPRS